MVRRQTPLRCRRGVCVARIPSEEVRQINLTYHGVPKAWFDSQDPAAPYTPPDFAREGFIHCTDGREAASIIWTKFCRQDPQEYVVLYINKEKVQPEIKCEDPAGIYPHIYGPLNRDAIVAVRPVARSADGIFHMPSRLWSTRPLTESDYPTVAAIYNQVSPTPATPEEFQQLNERRTRTGLYTQRALLDETGALRGFGLLWQEAWRQAGDLNLTVAVDPAFQRQGGGAHLYTEMERLATEQGCRTIDTAVSDNQPERLAFAHRRGYTEAEHFFRSVLDLSTWDEAAFRPALERAEANGYRFFRLSDQGPTEEAKRRLYELDMDCARDEPGFTDNQEWPPITFEQYQADLLTGERFEPAGIFIAEKDGEWAGLSGCHYPPGKDSAEVFFTCVRRGHRGQGLAQALKVLATAHARDKGRTKIYTGNHERNPAMLAVNRKFGFAPLPGHYVTRKSL